MPEKNKHVVFKKIEDGYILVSEDGSTIAVGLPEEVETLTAGEGKGKLALTGPSGEVKGERYRKVTYRWEFLSTTPISQEKAVGMVESVKESTGTLITSGHVNVPKFDIKTLMSIDFSHKHCPKCEHINPPSINRCEKCNAILPEAHG